MLRGRVGDTPIIGAGLYAGPHGAVAATGDGEEIMRRVLADMNPPDAMELLVTVCFSVGSAGVSLAVTVKP